MKLHNPQVFNLRYVLQQIYSVGTQLDVNWKFQIMSTYQYGRTFPCSSHVVVLMSHKLVPPVFWNERVKEFNIFRNETASRKPS